MSEDVEQAAAVSDAVAPSDAWTGRPWPSVVRPGHRGAALTALAEGRSLLVVGGAGVGKTHLVSAALADRAAATRALTALEAFVPTAVRDRAQRTVAAARLAVGAGDDWAALADMRHAVSGRPLDRVGHHLGHVVRVDDVAPEPAVLLRVEDAHLLDPTTAQALALLVREGEVQVVATLRPSGALSSPWLELWKDGVAERVDVGPLDPAQTQMLVEEALGGPVTSDTGRRIWRQTLGNPHHVRELLRSEVDSGALAQRRGVWVGLISGGPGQRVLDTVARDLERLAPPVRAALELVALAEPIPESMLDGLVASNLLEELTREGLVVRSTSASTPHDPDTLGEPLSPAVRLSPPAYADAVRALVPPDRRRHLFALVRTARARFRPEHEPPAGLLRSVLWALECDVHQSGERLLRAMHAAISLSRPEVAAQIGGAALRQVGGSGPRVDVLLVRAQAWRLLGLPERAALDLVEASERLAADNTGADHRLRQIRIAEQCSDLHQFHGDGPDESLELIDRFLDDLDEDDDPALRSALEVRRLVRLGTGGRFAESIEPSLAALRATGYRSPSVLALAAPAVFGLAQSGRLAEATALGARTLQAAQVHEQHHPWLVTNIRAAEFLVHLWAGDVEAAEQAAAPRAGGDWGHVTKYATDNTGRGLLAAARGRWSDALREHRAAGASLSVLDPYGLAPYAAAAEALAAAALGDRLAALRLMDVARRTPSRVSAMVESDLRLLLVDAQLWLGHPTARADALALARWCAERGLRRTELEALHRVLTAGQLEGLRDPADAAVLARLQHLGEVVSGPRACALVTHAAAMVAGDEELTAIAARDLTTTGLWLPSVRPWARLTAREREIAGLAAAGLSSRAIADRLTLSVRTVDSHLSRVFTKLGVRSRQQLRTLRDL